MNLLAAILIVSTIIIQVIWHLGDRRVWKDIVLAMPIGDLFDKFGCALAHKELKKAAAIAKTILELSPKQIIRPDNEMEKMHFLSDGLFKLHEDRVILYNTLKKNNCIDNVTNLLDNYEQCQTLVYKINKLYSKG